MAPSGLVMAGSRGIGFGCAEALVLHGYDVAICARGQDKLDQAVKELSERADGTTALGIQADVSVAEEVTRTVTETIEAFDGLDCLVVNAGGPPAGDFEELSEEAWEHAFQLTLMSAVRAIATAMPALRASSDGRIVVIGSSSAKRPIPGLCLSNVYRPALSGLVKSLAGDLAPDGITVNLVCPGKIDTDRVRALERGRAEKDGIPVDAIRAQTVAGIPFGRYGDPAELGALVAFLASSAAGYLTGQTIAVDGGLVVTLP